MTIPIDRVRLYHFAARLDRFLTRRLVRAIIFAAALLWAWLVLMSGVASA